MDTLPVTAIVDEVNQLSSRGNAIQLTDRGRLFQLSLVQENHNSVQKKLYTELNAINTIIGPNDCYN